MNRAQNMTGVFSPAFCVNLGLFALCTFLFYLVSGYPDMARSFPRLVLAMMLVVTATDSLNMIREKKGDTSSEKISEGDGTKVPFKVLYMVSLMFVFYLFLVLFGLITATLLFLLLSGWTLGYRKMKRLMISSVIITAFVYLMFKVIMNSILPEALILTIMRG